MDKWSFQHIRELMAQIALRGMDANELGCARISMMARSINSKTRPDTLVRDHRLQSHDFPLQRTAGPYIGSSAFRLSTTAASASLAGSCFSSESARGPSSMGSEDKVEQSLGRPCPMTGPSGHANSPHPSSREGRHSTAWWKYPPIAFDPERTSYRCSSSGPSELAAISPDAVHNDGQASR